MEQYDTNKRRESYEVSAKLAFYSLIGIILFLMILLIFN